MGLPVRCVEMLGGMFMKRTRPKLQVTQHIHPVGPTQACWALVGRPTNAKQQGVPAHAPYPGPPTERPVWQKGGPSVSPLGQGGLALFDPPCGPFTPPWPWGNPRGMRLDQGKVPVTRNILSVPGCHGESFSGAPSAPKRGKVAN